MQTQAKCIQEQQNLIVSLCYHEVASTTHASQNTHTHTHLITVIYLVCIIKCFEIVRKTRLDVRQLKLISFTTSPLISGVAVLKICC